MEPLVNELVSRLGITHAQAEIIATDTARFIKNHVPGKVAHNVDLALVGEPVEQGDGTTIGGGTVGTGSSRSGLL